MVSEKEAVCIRRFVWGELRDEADLSTLTLGILKKRFQALKKCDSLSPEVKSYMKQVVQEELLKMQDDEKNGSDSETKKPQRKRKRENENEEVVSESEDESKAKKSRNNHSSSSSESEDEEDRMTQSEASGDKQEYAKEEQEVKTSRPRNGNQQIDSDESSAEELQSNCSDGPEEMVGKNGETRTSSKGEGRKTPQSDKENDPDGNSKSETSDEIKSDESSDSEKEEKGEKKTDSDSSLPSLEDEKNDVTEKTKNQKKIEKKRVKKEERTKRPKSDDKSVARLKRYIALCGVRRNYKKLLQGCSSIRSQVTVLKKELEDLGVDGQPTIQKCKRVQMKREQAQELAALDVGNIITTQGRPTRRGASASQTQHESPASEYQRTLNSDSDSDQENSTHRGRRRMSEWANLQGIISDDGDSD